MRKPEEIHQQKIDYKEVFFHFWKYKIFFIFAIVGFLALAIFYIKNATPVYENYTIIQVNKKATNSFIQQDRVLDDFSRFYGHTNLEDEVEILRSFKWINNALLQMNAQVFYYKLDKSTGSEMKPDQITKEAEEILYNPPITVKYDIFKPQPIDVPFKVEILSNEEYKLSVKTDGSWLYDYRENKSPGSSTKSSFEKVCKFGEIVENENFKIKLQLTDTISDDFKKNYYFFTFNHLEYLTFKYLRNLTITPSDENSSVFYIQMKGKSPEKVTDFLNWLTYIYQKESIAKKNRVIDNTISFIDNQISNISDSLIYTEDRWEDFRSKYQVTDLSFQGERIFDQMKALEDEKAQLQVRLQYYEYLKEYLSENRDYSRLIAPSNSDVEDVILTDLISQLIQENTKRLSIVESGSEKNLFLEQLEINIRNLRNSILENVTSNQRKILYKLQDVNARLSALSTQISQLPKTERELFGIERKFRLTDATYTFLLQKRSEAQLVKASNTPDYEVIDPARIVTAKVITPKRRLSILLAIFLGFFVPILIILIKDFFQNAIYSKNDIRSLNFYPTLAAIFHNPKRESMLFPNYPQQKSTESFRNLATNIEHLKDKKNILVTSAKKGEGKSFISQNLAGAFAEMGYKTALVELDFRNPSLKAQLNIQPQKALNHYLTGEAKIEETRAMNFQKDLDVFVTTAASKNPFRSITSKKIRDFIEWLNSNYEKIIIDTPGVEEGSEAQFLMKDADFVVYIGRHTKSMKKSLKSNLQDFYSREFDNIGIVINDVGSRNNPYK
jgi:tyrosine-protein kinase Etk/Wzc